MIARPEHLRPAGDIMSEKKYVDFSTVRDLLQKANDAREEQSQEQQKAMEHAEWAASDNREADRLIPIFSLNYSKHFPTLNVFQKMIFFAQKMAEIRPDSPAQVRVIMAPYRIQISEGEIDQIITHVKQITWYQLSQETCLRTLLEVRRACNHPHLLRIFQALGRLEF